MSTMLLRRLRLLCICMTATIRVGGLAAAIPVAVPNTDAQAAAEKAFHEKHTDDLAQEPPAERAAFAQALLTAGLGEEARLVAMEGTVLEPNSALAQSTLGMALKHDLIGRPLKKGMDYDGADAAYRKAISLDPKDKGTRANLALLLEYDEDGTRYSEKARLKEAVEVLRGLKTVVIGRRGVGQSRGGVFRLP